MLKKKISLLCFAVAFAVLLTAGCGRKQAADLGGAPSEAANSETAAVRMEKSGTNQGDEKTVPEEDMGQSGPGIEAVESEESTGAGKKVEAFAEKIQEAVGDRDLEAFADLLFYPCVFVTADEETITLNNREDLFKQNPDMVFGDDLMVAVANVDTVSLNMTDKGVTMGEGTSKITFQKRSDGSFGIIEIRE
ncbi:hypothetical protein [Lacrimispora celerecrescens]|uniref:Uncharacterized protein n=1 Tax=[Clostridium] celerecrescens 18A TaxID=1286362 RepID=A0A2M8Z6D2_9FIRM|nr:hypothetical protein [Lacrimispora celerecrescens]PJJ28998.1 hypothetical protein H171_2524 [[Clostridium] celerecrescens 18A]